MTEDELERLARIADLAHEGHDQFPARLCGREICREISDLQEGT